MRNIHIPGRSNVLGINGMASTSQPLSTLEAISILKKGGNAVDAAIAASAVQAVVEPNSTGIGGDCFAIISLKGKKPISVNGSGICPKKASIDFFEKNKIKRIEPNSPHSVTIPGSVHAWYSIHKRFGKLDFAELFITAEKYAKNGYPVHEIVAKSWSQNVTKLKKNTASRNIFLNEDKPYFFGQKHKNQKLADTLKNIGKNGIKDFYRGYIAEDIVKTLNKLGGIHSLEDFAKQKTIFSDTISKSYKKYKIHQCPPNGPGITVLMMMGILEKFNFKKTDPLSVDRLHLQAEATKIAYEEREREIGDPNFIDINIEKLINSKKINYLTSLISKDKIYIPKNPTFTSHPETIYLTVVDKDQNAVSFINSLCFAFGSGITTDKTGILLQNRGVNFRLERNHPNIIEGHKRPLHTIIPGLVTNKHNKTILCYGVMGGQYQPVGHAHILQNIFDFNLSVQESIDLPRAFVLDNIYHLEKTIPKNVLKELKNKGHNVQYTNNTYGGGQAIFIDTENGILVGGSDFRKDGCAIGY